MYEAEGFYGLELDAEWQDLNYVSRLARGIDAHGEAFVRWSQLAAETERLDEFEQRYVGHFETGANYAEHLADELGGADWLSGVPEAFKPYVRFDSAAYIRDLVASGCVAVVEGRGGVHVFSL